MLKTQLPLALPTDVKILIPEKTFHYISGPSLLQKAFLCIPF